MTSSPSDTDSALPVVENRTPPGARRLGVFTTAALAVYVLDVISKIVVVELLAGGPPIQLLRGLFTLRLVRNPGAAFGIGVDMTLAFTAIAALVIAVILRSARRLRSVPWAVALGMLLGGAAGNLTDRIFRAPAVFRGHVVDFLELPHWPVFNVADSAIVLAGVLMVVLSFRGVHPEGDEDLGVSARPAP
ncbi:MAG: signal peptidase II [Streptomycetales bacterium]